jgi:lipoprotein NlpI
MIRSTLTACGFAALIVTLDLPLSAADDGKAPAFDPDEWQAQVERLTSAITDNPKNVGLYSRRGDAYFFLGQFADSVADYDQMVTLEPSEDASHWRRGIALFYAQKYDEAARQFERYHSFDDVDRENGIWRYLCQVKADGVEKARAGLLKYEKDDREPFGDVYRLFAETIEPPVILEHIEQADVAAEERLKRRFYAHLYIGLWHAVHDRPQEAKPHLQQAAENPWPAAAGYGPRYMWHVARLHYDLLSDAAPPK